MICFSFSFFHVFACCLLFCFFSISNLSVSALCVARGALTRGPAPRNLVTVGNISRPQRNSLFEYICIRHRSSGNRANPLKSLRGTFPVGIIVKTASHTHTPSLTSGTPADPRRPHSRPQQAVVQTWSCRCQTARAQNTRKYSAMCPAAKLVQDQPFLQRSLQGSHPTVMTQTRDAFDAPLAHVHWRHKTTPVRLRRHLVRLLTLPYPGILQGTYHMATRPYRRRTTNGPTSLRPCFPGRLMRWSCGDVRLFCRVPSLAVCPLAVYSVLR